MKLLYLITISLLLGITYSYGQTAIAVCIETGYYGYAYNGGGPEDKATTDKQYGALALKSCKDISGTNCKLIGVYNSPGWWPLIVGLDNNGRPVVQIANGVASESDARAEALKNYRNSGGVNPEKFKMATWRAYPEQ